MRHGILALASICLTIQVGTAWAEGLLYRSVATGRWVGIAARSDALPGGSAFAGTVFAGFPIATEAAIDSSTGLCTATVAVFSATLKAAAPNTGIFLYDALTDEIHDGVIEGEATPIGGVWAPLSRQNPSIAIDPALCRAHVVFRGKANGSGTSNQDTGIFDAVISLADFSLLGVSVIAREGVTTAPAPFPAAAVFNDFASARPSAAYDAGLASIGAAFQAKVTGGGTGAGNDSGIFLSTSLGLFTAAREGDSSCMPGWVGAGALYADFPSTLPALVGSGCGAPFCVAYRAKSSVGPMASDSAIEVAQPLTGCGSASHAAVEGQATPAGGTFADLLSTTPIAYNGTPGVGTAFVARIASLSGTSKAVFQGDPLTGPTIVVARHGQPDTPLSEGSVVLASDPSPAVDALGDVAFVTAVSGFSSGLFLFNSTSANPAQLVSLGGHGPQIDRLGNMTARFR
jgi:hypothetical protein